MNKFSDDLNRKIVKGIRYAIIGAGILALIPFMLYIAISIAVGTAGIMLYNRYIRKEISKSYRNESPLRK